nr:hypothetical protein Iba_chr13fCG8550 [Ipomoea batatas]
MAPGWGRGRGPNQVGVWLGREGGRPSQNELRLSGAKPFEEGGRIGFLPPHPINWGAQPRRRGTLQSKDENMNRDNKVKSHIRGISSAPVASSPTSSMVSKRCKFSKVRVTSPMGSVVSLSVMQSIGDKEKEQANPVYTLERPQDLSAQLQGRVGG